MPEKWVFPDPHFSALGQNPILPLYGKIREKKKPYFDKIYTV